MEKWKNKGLKVNLKKSFLIFFITGILAVLAGSGVLAFRFKDRFKEMKSTCSEEERDQKGKYASEGNGEENGKEYVTGKDGEWNRETGKREEWKKEKEHDWEDLQLSKTDIALIAGCGIIGIGLGIWYWILCMLWALQKAERLGVRSCLWVVGTFFFNLAAIVALYLFGYLRGTCSKCGKVRIKEGRFCSRCGAALKQICPKCGHEEEKNCIYCSQCGVKLEESKLSQEADLVADSDMKADEETNATEETEEKK